MSEKDRLRWVRVYVILNNGFKVMNARLPVGSEAQENFLAHQLMDAISPVYPTAILMPAQQAWQESHPEEWKALQEKWAKEDSEVDDE